MAIPKSILVTGGCGFIGSNFVRYWLKRYSSQVVVYDKITYAGRKENLHDLWGDDRLSLVIGDINNIDLLRQVCKSNKIDLIINFAAETHVDQSILNSLVFTETNVKGLHVILEVVRELDIRFHHVSTDEVYGHIPNDHQSLEIDPLCPRSPYSASKAAADHLVQAYHTTYNIPVTITRGANNVGAYQYLEKVVPLFTTNAILGYPLPVYGDGKQMRDYSHVYDHCTGIDTVLSVGELGEVYNVGTGCEISNLDMVRVILNALDKDDNLVQHVEDRLGHDRRYSMNVKRLYDLGWKPKYNPQKAIMEAVTWYVDNRWWWEPLRNEKFNDYYLKQYAKRLEGAK